MTKRAIFDVSSALRKMRQRRGEIPDNAPIGLPPRGDNEDRTMDKYQDENLTDPGWINGVAGTGDGPVIGRNRPNTR